MPNAPYGREIWAHPVGGLGMAYKVLYISNSILKLKFTTNKKILNIRLLTYLRLGITHKGLSNVYLELPRLVLLHVFGPGNLVFMSSSKTLAMSSTSGKKKCFLSYSIS